LQTAAYYNCIEVGMRSGFTQFFPISVYKLDFVCISWFHYLLSLTCVFTV